MQICTTPTAVTLPAPPTYPLAHLCGKSSKGAHEQGVLLPFLHTHRGVQGGRDAVAVTALQAASGILLLNILGTPIWQWQQEFTRDAQGGCCNRCLLLPGRLPRRSSSRQWCCESPLNCQYIAMHVHGIP
jgi:hypothetical protein